MFLRLVAIIALALSAANAVADAPFQVAIFRDPGIRRL